MTTSLTEIERQVEMLSRDETAHLFDFIARKLGNPFPGIERIPGVCGGDPVVVRTRIPVWLLEKMRRQNVSETEILRHYPTLRAADLVSAWAYARSHRELIDAQILENESD